MIFEESIIKIKAYKVYREFHESMTFNINNTYKDVLISLNKEFDDAWNRSMIKKNYYVHKNVTIGNWNINQVS